MDSPVRRYARTQRAGRTGPVPLCARSFPSWQLHLLERLRQPELPEPLGPDPRLGRGDVLRIDEADPRLLWDVVRDAVLAEAQPRLAARAPNRQEALPPLASIDRRLPDEWTAQPSGDGIAEVELRPVLVRQRP